MGIFRVGVFQGGSLMGENFRGGNFQGGSFPDTVHILRIADQFPYKILKVSRTFFPIPGLPWKFSTQSTTDIQPSYAMYESLLLRISKIFDILLLALFMCYINACIVFFFFFRERCFVKNQQFINLLHERTGQGSKCN